MWSEKYLGLSFAYKAEHGPLLVPERPVHSLKMDSVWFSQFVTTHFLGRHDFYSPRSHAGLFSGVSGVLALAENTPENPELIDSDIYHPVICDRSGCDLSTHPKGRSQASVRILQNPAFDGETGPAHVLCEQRRLGVGWAPLKPNRSQSCALSPWRSYTERGRCRPAYLPALPWHGLLGSLTFI